MVSFFQKHIHWNVSLPGWLTKIAVPKSSAKRAFPKPLGSFLISSTPKDGSLGAIILFSLKHNGGNAAFIKLKFKPLMPVVSAYQPSKKWATCTQPQFGSHLGLRLSFAFDIIYLCLCLVFVFVMLLRSQPSQSPPQPRWPSQTACLALGSPRRMDGAINQ